MNGFDFDYGWRKPINILFKGKDISIECVLEAYSGEEITVEQLTSYQRYEADKQNYDRIATRLLKQFIEENNIENDEVTVKSLFIQRNGDFSLLCDCAWDIENGIAVVLSPKEYVTVQDNVL